MEISLAKRANSVLLGQKSGGILALRKKQPPIHDKIFPDAKVS